MARDRLYCAAEKSRERRSAQTALFHILDALVRMLAPLIPFTAEEVYSYHAGQESLESVHLTTMHPANPSWRDDDLEARWDRLLKVRDEALKLLEAMRKSGTIGAPLDAAISLGADGGSESGLAETLKRYREESERLVHRVGRRDSRRRRSRRGPAAGQRPRGLSPLTVRHFARAAANPAITLVGRHASGAKCARCWKYFDNSGGETLDARCRAVVGS